MFNKFIAIINKTRVELAIKTAMDDLVGFSIETGNRTGYDVNIELKQTISMIYVKASSQFNKTDVLHAALPKTVHDISRFYGDVESIIN